MPVAVARVGGAVLGTLLLQDCLSGGDRGDWRAPLSWSQTAVRWIPLERLGGREGGRERVSSEGAGDVSREYLGQGSLGMCRT